MVWSTNMLLFIISGAMIWQTDVLTREKKKQQQLYIKERDKTNLHTVENGSPTHTQTKMPWFSEAIFELRSNA